MIIFPIICFSSLDLELSPKKTQHATFWTHIYRSLLNVYVLYMLSCHYILEWCLLVISTRDILAANHNQTVSLDHVINWRLKIQCSRVSLRFKAIDICTARSPSVTQMSVGMLIIGWMISLTLWLSGRKSCCGSRWGRLGLGEQMIRATIERWQYYLTHGV